MPPPTRPYRGLLTWSLATLAAVAYIVALADAPAVDKAKMLVAVVVAAAAVAVVIARAARNGW